MVSTDDWKLMWNDGSVAFILQWRSEGVHRYLKTMRTLVEYLDELNPRA